VHAHNNSRDLACGAYHRTEIRLRRADSPPLQISEGKAERLVQQRVFSMNAAHAPDLAAMGHFLAQDRSTSRDSCKLVSV
jgi:hypothetical protein